MHYPRYKLCAIILGFVRSISAIDVGIVCWELGAGRKVKGDEIAYHVGCKILLKPGDEIKIGQIWAIIHHNDPLPEHLLLKMNSSIKISKENQKQDNLVIKTIVGH